MMMKVDLRTQKFVFGFAALASVPVAVFAVGCSGADEPSATDPNTPAVGEDETEGTGETGQAWQTESCTPRSQKNAKGWNYQQILKSDKTSRLEDVCGKNTRNCLACNKAPGCNSANKGKRMKCIAIESNNDWRIYECRKGPAVGPVPKHCTLAGGGSAASEDTGGKNDPGTGIDGDLSW